MIMEISIARKSYENMREKNVKKILKIYRNKAPLKTEAAATVYRPGISNLN